MFAAIFIPNFSLQAALRHEPDLRQRAVALVDPELPKPVVVQLTSTAQACGVCAGLTASQAMARCAELIIKSRSPVEEQSATEVLLQTAYAFSPNIESTAPGVCTMELKGMVFGSNGNSMEQWAEKIVEVLAQFYLEAKIGLAPTPELALLMARARQSHVAAGVPPAVEGGILPPGPAPARFSVPKVTSSVPPGETPGSTAGETPAATSLVDSFPISSLEPPAELLQILHRWGIRTVGALLALGKDQVTERLGPAAAELFDRVSPDSPRPLKLVVPTEEFAEQMEFENEIETTEPLLFVLRRFVEQLSRRLELIYLVIAEFNLQLGLSSGAKYERQFKVPSPTGNIEILFRMLQTHLETVRTDSPITSLRLSARPAKPEAQQFGLFESTLRDPNQFAETLARLTALLGPENIGTPQLIPSHKPDSFAMSVPEFDSRSNANERRGRFRPNARTTSPSPPRSGGLEPLGKRRKESARSERPARAERAGASESLGRGEVVPRAHGETSFGVRCSMFDVRCSQFHGPHLRRFRPALPSHIEFREGTPSLLRSHIFIGPIVATSGPFLSSGNWWDSARWVREEWDVETSDGSLFRIFRSAEGCFVEGVYD